MRKTHGIAGLARRQAAQLAWGIAALGVAIACAEPSFAGNLGTADSATVVEKQLNATTFEYSITLNNPAANGSPIGTFWLGWVPGQNFLDSNPLSVSSPAGWSDIITNDGPSDGFGIQWVSNAPSTNVAPGAALKGFTFTSLDTPAKVFGSSAFYPGTPVLTSTTYAGTPFTGASSQFIASGQGSTVPLPPAVWSGLSMLLAMGTILQVRRVMRQAV